MSYDLIPRMDGAFSEMIPRDEINALISAFPHVKSNGPGGFVLERGGDLYMEIDAEFVSAEGDSIEADPGNPAPEVNCLNFHIPYAFMEGSDAWRTVARGIASKLGWELYDPQEDRLFQVDSGKASKPWWKFW